MASSAVRIITHSPTETLCDEQDISIASWRDQKRADTFAVTAAEFTAERTANIMVNKYIRLWWCPSTIPSDTGTESVPFMELLENGAGGASGLLVER